MYDCIIIGGGVIGATLLNELSKYDMKTVLLEAASDVACGATKANSGILHAGYDSPPNSLKAKYNVFGNPIAKRICNELGLPINNCGSLVVARAGQESGIIELKRRGDINGVDTEIIYRERIKDLEPNIADDVELALFAKDASIISPYKLAIASADQAILNGAQVLLNKRVIKISEYRDFCEVFTHDGSVYRTRIIVNAAGSGAYDINKMIHAEEYNPTYRRGEYYLLDKSEISTVSRIIFPLPTDKGKGILIAPTVSGNVICGPTAIDQPSPTDVSVSYSGLEDIRSNINNLKKIDLSKAIRVYAGVRTVIGDDFIVGFSSIVDKLYQIIGICSPGLTASTAIAEDSAAKIADQLSVSKNITGRVKPTYLKSYVSMTSTERELAAINNPLYSRMVCRCEYITEAEVVDAIHSPLPAVNIDAIKRRVRCGMGRCQGGFCTLRVMEILSRELNIPLNNITKCGEGSEIIVDKIKPYIN